MIHVLAQRVLAVAPRPVETGHAAQLRQHGTLVRPELIHRVLLLRRLLLLRGDHHARVVLVQVARVGRARLHLGGDVVRRGLGLHARGRAGVRRLRLRPGGGLRRSHLVCQGGGQRLALQVRVGGLGHLLRLLGAHGVAVLSRRPPGAQVLALEQPLVERLLQQGLRRRRRGPTLVGLGALRGLLRTDASSWSGVTPRQPHGALLLHLEVMLVLLLQPVLECSGGLLLRY